MPTGICGVKYDRPMGLVSFVDRVRGGLNVVTGGGFVPVRRKSICRAGTSAAGLRHRINCYPSIELPRKVTEFIR